MIYEVSSPQTTGEAHLINYVHDSLVFDNQKAFKYLLSSLVYLLFYYIKHISKYAKYLDSKTGILKLFLF